jgi:hypothetical protein
MVTAAMLVLTVVAGLANVAEASPPFFLSASVLGYGKNLERADRSGTCGAGTIVLPGGGCDACEAGATYMDDDDHQATACKTCSTCRAPTYVMKPCVSMRCYVAVRRVGTSFSLVLTTHSIGTLRTPSPLPGSFFTRMVHTGRTSYVWSL